MKRTPNKCLRCGEDTPTNRSQYCGSYCKGRAAYEKRKLKNPKSYSIEDKKYKRDCLNCGLTFGTNIKKQIFCNPICTAENHRKRMKDGKVVSIKEALKAKIDLFKEVDEALKLWKKKCYYMREDDCFIIVDLYDKIKPEALIPSRKNKSSEEAFQRMLNDIIIWYYSNKKYIPMDELSDLDKQ